MKKVVDWLKKNEGLILILGLLVLLRLPSLFEPAWYGDENIYLAIGQGVRKGLILYKEITDFPNKPPLIYLLAALVGNVFYFRFLLLFWSTINAALIYCLSKTLWPKNKWTAYITTLVFVFLTSLPFWEGNIANGEIFMIMPTTAAMLLLWKAKLNDGLLRQYFWSGVVFSIAFLFKIPVALDIAAALLFFFIVKSDKSVFLLKGLKEVFLNKYLWIFLVGLAVPVTLALIFHASQGVLPTTLLAIAFGSSGYVSVWQQQSGIMAYLSFSSLTARLALLALISLLVYGFRKRFNQRALWVCLWFIFALFGVLLSARPYPHYLLQLTPALVMLVGVLLAEKLKSNGLILIVVSLLIGVAAYMRFGFGAYPVAGYYQNFIGFINGDVSREEYIKNFDARMPRNYALAKYLKTHTDAYDKIYIWGTEPGVYVLSDRLPVGRLTTSFHVEDLNEFERLANEIGAFLPRYIVVMETERRDFKQLKEILDLKYNLVRRINEALVYRLMPDVVVQVR